MPCFKLWSVVLVLAGLAACVFTLSNQVNHNAALAQNDVVRPDNDNADDDAVEDDDAAHDEDDDHDHDHDQPDGEELELHRFHLEIEHAELELHHKHLELATRLADASESSLRAAAVAISMTHRIMDEEDAAEFLALMLENAKTPEVSRLLQLKLAHLYAQLDRPEESKEMLKALLFKQ